LEAIHSEARGDSSLMPITAYFPFRIKGLA
jgi:hypothetical protein